MDTNTNTPTAEPRGRRVLAENQGALTVAGEVAREAYLVAALDHLNEFTTARLQSLAYALFPGRSQAAATAATQRTLSWATEQGLVASKDDPGTQFRYYALTRKGAAYLNDRTDRPTKAGATTAKLESLTRANHREWTSLLTVWGRLQQGLEPMNEFALWGTAGQELRERFQAVPDGLTFDTDPATPIVYWHEVELSRRSQWTDEETAKAKREATKAGKHFRGCGKYIFRVLVWRIHRLRYLVKDGREFDIRLVLHCATPQIKRELGTWIELTFTDTPTHSYGLRKLDQGARYMLDYAGGRGQMGEGLNILLEDLPESPAKVWHGDGVFPWPGAACYEPKPVEDRFLKAKG